MRRRDFAGIMIEIALTIRLALAALEPFSAAVTICRARANAAIAPS